MDLGNEKHTSWKSRTIKKKKGQETTLFIVNRSVQKIWKQEKSPISIKT